ncbi:hypothetical protein P5673_020626 [Acropora cervicornis]|uniref:Uncharacterized protein n=1 Tax=Acropora cervicornis TaxID=6130 RepID=A0AAD9V1B9_ACRCE|nr:hypothetical protein P5673_020626 [Acropora cervicornis]
MKNVFLNITLAVNSLFCRHDESYYAAFIVNQIYIKLYHFTGRFLRKTHFNAETSWWWPILKSVQKRKRKL